MKYSVVVLSFLVGFATATPAPAAGVAPLAVTSSCKPGEKSHRNRCVDLRCFDSDFRRAQEVKCGSDYDNDNGERGHDKDDLHWYNGRCDEDFVLDRRNNRRCIWAGCYDRFRLINDNDTHYCPPYLWE